MSDLDEQLRAAPSLEARREHQDATVHQALHAFHVQQNRKRVIVPFVTSFLGAAAALTIAAILYFSDREVSHMGNSSDELSREVIVRAYLELRETFPEGLAAVVFVDGEMQIYPGLIGAHSVEPTYVEMKIGSTEVKVIAAQGTALPIEINGNTVSIEFMPDASGQPTVSGEDFYWSVQDQYMPLGREVLEAKQLEAVL